MYTSSVSRVISVMTVVSVILGRDLFIVINEVFTVVNVLNVMRVVTVIIGSVFSISMATS